MKYLNLCFFVLLYLTQIRCGQTSGETQKIKQIYFIDWKVIVQVAKRDW